ncbi:hypothetical protein [Brevundimonas sp.]|uniref:hypothetical protein n=1 Tax=Brevundimonas sp. TaxID=1871086 RepID=UPI001DFBC29E|nr:hypothetical protein [Brevundimonas sp.]MBA3999434.1 hypothetical protein [Brevundimonas sp.]
MTLSAPEPRLISSIARTGWRQGDRLVQLVADGARLGLRFTPKLALDLALRLLQPEAKAASHAPVGIKARAVATARTDQGHAVLSFALPGEARLSVVLPPEVERQLVQGLSRPAADPHRRLMH